MVRLIVACALLVLGCRTSGLDRVDDASADLSGLACTSLGARCVPTTDSNGCPGGDQKLDQQQSYCGSPSLSCCLAPCPASAEVALGQLCAGPRVCDYVDDCSRAVCQSTNGVFSWYVYTSVCP